MVSTGFTENTKTSEGVRAKAGKALVIFLAVMAILTFASNTLQEMVVPVVTPIAPQRGTLEKRIDASGTLASAKSVPVVIEEAARIADVLVKEGAKVLAGEALMTLDYTDIAKDKYHALLEAINSFAAKQQAYDWAAADISTQALDTLDKRRSDLSAAEEALLRAEEALLQAHESGDPALLAQAEQKVQDAQDKVAYQKRRLDQYITPRSYISSGRELVVAREAMDSAARDFFGIMDELDMNPYAADGSMEALIDKALRAVYDGGQVADAIPYYFGADYKRTVHAPVSGEVSSVSAEAGHLVSTGTPVLMLSDLSGGLSLTVTVSEDEAAEMVVGDMAGIIIGDNEFEYPIVSIAASKETGGSYDVAFVIGSGYGAVGQRATMRFRKKTKSYDLLIPLSALREDSAGTFVYVVDKQEGSLGAQVSAKRVDVYVLDQDSTRAALQSGVNQRDLIIARGDREIQDGDRVRLEGE